jgi:hypothetical protein
VPGTRTVAVGDALLACSIMRRLIERLIHRPAAGAHNSPDLQTSSRAT